MSDDTARLAIYQNERHYFERLAASVRALLAHKALKPQQVVGLGHLLQALQVLPLVDDAISVTVSVYPIPGSTSLDLSLSIGDDELELAVIERFGGPEGADAISHRVASYNVYGEREFGDQWSPHYWLCQWEEAVETGEARLEIVDHSDSDVIDWERRAESDDFMKDENSDD